MELCFQIFVGTLLNACHYAFVSSADFSQLTFFHNFFSETLSVSNGLDPESQS